MHSRIQLRKYWITHSPVYKELYISKTTVSGRIYWKFCSKLTLLFALLEVFAQIEKIKNIGSVVVV